MSLKSKLQEGLKAAMKSKDKLLLQTVRALLTEIQYLEMQSSKEISTDDEQALLKRELKKRKEVIEFSEQAGRTEAKQEAEAEAKIIEGFLPKQLSAEELESIISTFKNSNPSANMGAVMAYLKGSFGGQYDGKLASEIVKKLGI